MIVLELQSLVLGGMEVPSDLERLHWAIRLAQVNPVVPPDLCQSLTADEDFQYYLSLFQERGRLETLPMDRSETSVLRKYEVSFGDRFPQAGD